MDLDISVKLNVYETLARTGRAPNSTELSAVLSVPKEEVEASFLRLQANRLLVVEPGDPSRIRMAHPFSAVPTPFSVVSQGKSYFANCSWDSYGILAALHQDGIVNANDPNTGEPLVLQVSNGQPGSEPYVAHFAVPTAKWWDDVIYT